MAPANIPWPRHGELATTSLMTIIVNDQAHDALTGCVGGVVYTQVIPADHRRGADIYLALHGTAAKAGLCLQIGLPLHTPMNVWPSRS